MPIMVTVVVATYRRTQLLDRCLQALMAQEFPPDAYEIIVVDDGPEDTATHALVTDWQLRLVDSLGFLAPPVASPIPVTGRGGAPAGRGGAPAGRESASAGRNRMPVISGNRPAARGNGPAGHPDTDTEVVYQVQPGSPGVPRAPGFPRPPGFPRLYYLPSYHTQGPAAARNLGWRAAAGEIIAFTDDDTIPDPRWLAEGVSAFAGDVAGVSGRVIVPLPTDPTDNERNTTYLERSHFVTANCFYRRKVLEAVGGFDERFKTAWREDSDLFFTLCERGYPLAWSGEAVVLHPVRPERWGSSIRAQKKSYYNALLFKKHPQLYRKYIQSGPPWHYYGMLLGTAIFIAGLLAYPVARLLVLPHALALPLMALGFALWAFLEARFIITRLKNTAHTKAHVIEMIVTSLVIPSLSVYYRVRGAIRWKVWFI